MSFWDDHFCRFQDDFHSPLAMCPCAFCKPNSIYHHFTGWAFFEPWGPGAFATWCATPAAWRFLLRQRRHQRWHWSVCISRGPCRVPGTGLAHGRIWCLKRGQSWIVSTQWLWTHGFEANAFQMLEKLFLNFDFRIEIRGTRHPRQLRYAEASGNGMLTCSVQKSNDKAWHLHEYRTCECLNLSRNTILSIFRQPVLMCFCPLVRSNRYLDIGCKMFRAWRDSCSLRLEV